jgi:hypothetical protein
MSLFFENGIKDVIFAYGAIESEMHRLRDLLEKMTLDRDAWQGYAQDLQKEVEMLKQ